MKGIFSRELETNRHVFQFFHEKDLNRVMDGSLWIFNEILLILERLKEGDNPRLIQLTIMEI